MKCSPWTAVAIILLGVILINSWILAPIFHPVNRSKDVKASFANDYEGYSRSKDTLSTVSLDSHQEKPLANCNPSPSHNAQLHLVVQFPVISGGNWSLANIFTPLTLRQQEYTDTLQKNLLHPLVSEVHLLYESPRDKEFIQNLNLKEFNKLKLYYLGRRLHYVDAFEYASLFLQHKTTVIINADCYIGKGFENVERNLLKQRVVYALTRHESPASMRNCNTTDFCGPKAKYIGSHDAFVFHLTSPFPRKVLERIDFRPNIFSIEKVVIYNLRRYGKFIVRNPCRILHIVHNHCSNLRFKKERFVGGNRSRLHKYLKLDRVPLSELTAPFSDL